jgi:hypothetical protein
MKIAWGWFCAATAGLLLSGTAWGQVAPWPDADLGPDYTITAQEEGKQPGKVPEKLAPPKDVDAGGMAHDGCAAPAEDNGCCAPPADNGCGCEKSNGNGCKSNGNGCCKKKKKKNGKKKNGCAKKNGCGGNGNGCNGAAEEPKNGENGCEEKKEENGCCAEEEEEEEEEEDECCGYCYLFGPKEAVSFWDEMWDHCDDECKPCYKIAGWIQAGYHSHCIPLSQVNGDLLAFEDVPHHFHARQCYAYIEKALDTEDGCCDWGFRADVVYGTDAQKTQAFGNPPPAGAEGWDNDWDNGVYGWAIPQAYGMVGCGDLTVKIGHMYTYNGYEVIPATGNFFFTHALTMFNSEPFTHTGTMAEYKANDDLTIMAGWMLGWDTGYDRFEDGSMWHGGFSYQITEDVKLVYISCAGDFGRRGKDAYMQTLILDTKLREDWQWVLQSDILRIDEAFDGTPLGDDATSIVNYLFYTLNDCWKLGVRFEWWKGNLPAPPYPDPAFGSHYEVTYGVNYKPHANFVIRPEMRHDWSPATDIRRDTFAVDAIFTW